jgi:hypothetical protein
MKKSVNCSQTFKNSIKMFETIRKLTTILLVLFIISCGAIVRSTINEDDKQIPIGFGKEDVTILAVRKMGRYDKWLEERFSENYNGKYVIIDPKELANTKYSDTKKYRYIFDETETTKFNRVTATSTSSSMADTYISFSLTDRSTGTVYKTRTMYAAPTALMRDYLIALERVRQRNSGK